MAIRLLTCLMILSAVAIQRNGSLLGHDFAPIAAEDVSVDSPVMNTSDGIIINTAGLTEDIKGYGGATPLQIKIKGGKIAEIIPEKNAETPEFFGRVEKELLPKWIGVAVNDVADTKIDGVTGATLSSNAVNATIKSAMEYAMKESGAMIYEESRSSASYQPTAKNIAAVVVILLAMILPLVIKDKRYRYVQLALNVVVLGLWCGTFLSYTLFVNYLSNGVNVLVSLPWILMLVAAFIYPYFGKKTYYCTWVCPFGSLQELAGKSVKYKLKLSPGTVKFLTAFQDWLWVALMFIMCAGIYSSWMDYELFTAFLFRQAGIGVLIAAAVFILLSFVVMRPYCRFVCPTGCLFKFSQISDKK